MLLLKTMVTFRCCSSFLLLRRANRMIEDGDFPAAVVLRIIKAWPAQVELGGSGGSARPRLAAVLVGSWVLRDWNVIPCFFEGCNAGRF